MPKKIDTAVAKSTAKKVVPNKEKGPKSAPLPKPSKKVGVGKKQAVELVTYSMKAVIPTQQYGNMQPEIVVRAATIDEARAFIEPIMEDIYQKYAEATPDGRTPKFFKKADVKVAEKTVTPPATSQPTAPTGAVASSQTKEESKSIALEKASENPQDVPFVGNTLKSPKFIQGEGMIENTMSIDALDVVEGKIRQSKNLNDQEKDQLMTLVLMKRKTFTA